jgi:hypothetical protein
MWAGAEDMRRLLGGGIAVAVAAVSVPVGALAASPTSPAAPPRSIAVSVPSDAVPLRAGETAPITIRVLDPTTMPVTVTVTGMGLNLGDNGQVSFTGAPDSRWARQADFPPGELIVPAMGFINVSITVRMPAVISPDLYYLGFVVRPVPSGPGIKVINEIGGFLTIDVPGPRVRSLTADLDTAGFNFGPIHLASLVIGNQVAGQLNVHNKGGAAVQFWGENDVTSWVINPPTQQRIGKSLVPIGRSRSFVVGAEPGLLIDVVTLAVTVTYPDNTESSTKAILITRQMLVISPWAIVIVCLITALLAGWRLRVRLRRRALARLRPQGTASRVRRPS